ncbi:hypothetical protein M422DRAFT_60274 [Sphaerobolus stellatus SS14]|uniref:Integrase core domain-containing protein n=1 Tax=Sphaerobolus stellatus (strain SS14) TaxID=990650 RepID=A0A0C9VP64_SPHS4|nr:hypothetical protein M422DRAFT_60274 [Sphaerobolus stellatus SS14]
MTYLVNLDPADDILGPALHRYAWDGLNRSQVCDHLVKDFKLSVGKTKIDQLYDKYEVPTARKPRLACEVATEAVIDEIDKDINDLNGPDFIVTHLRTKGIMVPCDPLGIWHSVSSDGHEKLSRLALNMGVISLPIYAFKEKWSDYLLYIVITPNVTIPIQMTTDCGSETVWMFGFQIALREGAAPQIDSEVFPAHKYIKSVHNTVIEAFWHWLLEKLGYNIKDHILQGQNENIFNPINPIHIHIFYWIFVPLVQAELNKFQLYWNTHHIRLQPGKQMPSGHVPNHVFSDPASHGGEDLGIKVNPEVVQALRQHLEEEEGSRTKHLPFVSEEFAEAASTVSEELNLPSPSWENSWDIFAKIVTHLGELVE